jgi:flagellar protein FlaG
MKITPTVNETHKTSPISMEQKLDIKPYEIKTVKKIDPQQETQKFGKNYTESDLQKAVDETNRLIFKDDKRFEFKVHERTGRYLVKLVNKETDEVIKEIPPEKILDLIARIWDLVGILVDERG